MKNKGFTLIEVMIIVAILAIMATMFFSFWNAWNAIPVPTFALMATNAVGQQTWKVPEDKLQEFQLAHNQWKTVSIAYGSGEWIIIIEPLPAER